MDEVGPYRLDLPHSGDLELWMRMATVDDVGFVVGPNQAYYRRHNANMHVDMFGSGTDEGRLIDLRERWKAFEALFEAPPARVGNWVQLQERTRKSLAAEVDFAQHLDPIASYSPAGRALARRSAVGFLPGPLHPLWAPSAVWTRYRAPIMTWRRERIGV